jgi:hypothetical protein
MNGEFGADGSRGGRNCRDVWSIIRQTPRLRAAGKVQGRCWRRHLIALPRTNFCAPGDKSRLGRTAIS